MALLAETLRHAFQLARDTHPANSKSLLGSSRCSLTLIVASSLVSAISPIIHPAPGEYFSSSSAMLSAPVCSGRHPGTLCCRHAVSSFLRVLERTPRTRLIVRPKRRRPIPPEGCKSKEALRDLIRSRRFAQFAHAETDFLAQVIYDLVFDQSQVFPRSFRVEPKVISLGRLVAVARNEAGTHINDVRFATIQS